MGGERAVERRIVTILFADLVGFTSFSEQLDAEDVATVQAAYFATVRETIERYGGRLEKFIGDAAMAVFGVPRARDDDAERAVRAALALTAAVDQLGARIGLEAGALAVRVGVNSGEVIHTPDAGSEEAMVTGDPVNVAARLQAAAGTGRVLVGETTALAVGASVELAEVEELELKGKAQPVRARPVRGVHAEPSRDLAMGALRAPLLGRDADLKRLLDELEHAAESPRRVVVVAPPGVGKTRLVEELMGRAGDGVAVARARLRPDVLAPFDPVAQLLEAAGAAADAQELEARLTAAGIAPLRAGALADEALAILRPQGDAALGADREARFAAWVELLDRLAGDRTGLWLVEDVHWAGPDFLAFLAFAGAQPGSRLVLATARPSLLETDAAWCSSGSLFHLPSLPPADASQLVRALVDDALPHALVDEIAARSDGNALFIEELLRMWISLGELVRTDGGWTLRREAGDIPLPPTVQAIYAAQLDDLPATARELARRASVAGRRFPGRALGVLEVAETDAGIDLLARRALLSGPAADELLGPSYAYRHALLRDAGYASLARAERVRLHVALARWLEGAAGSRVEQAAELIGRHYARALAGMPALAREAAPGVGRDDCRRLAAAWFERAAGFSLELDAHESARELFARALELTSDDEASDRARRLLSLGEVTAASVDMDEGARLVEEALSIARAAGDRSGIAGAAAELSRILDQQVQFMPAARVAEAALAEIGEADDGETGWLLLRRAFAISNGSDAEAGPRVDIERALGIARAAGDSRLELEALAWLATSGWIEPEALAELERLALERRAWRKAADALQTRALILVPDHAARAAEVAGRAVDLCEAHGLREELTWSHYTHVEAGLASGEWDGAVAAARRAFDVGIAGGYDRAVLRTWSAVLPIISARRDEELLEQAHDWLSNRLREPESPSPYARVMLAARRLELVPCGLEEPFVPDVDERLASFALPYASPSWLAALEIVFDAWLSAGELEGAARALEAMRPAAENPARATLGRAEYPLLRARLRAARGEDASGDALRALEGFRASAAPWWQAKALRLTGTLEAAAEAAELELALGIAAAEGGERIGPGGLEHPR